MLDLSNTVYNSDYTKLAYLIARSLADLRYSLPNDDQLLNVIKNGDSSVEVAHDINKYYVSLLKEALLKSVGTCRAAIEKLLNVQYWKHDGDPSGDRCSIHFLHYMLENPTSSDIKNFCAYMSYYNLNLHLGGFNGHTTFSLALPQEAFNELKEELEFLELYMCPLIFPDSRKNSPPVTKGYLLDVGLMRQHDTETNNYFNYVQRTFNVIGSYNRFILHAEDFLPDYLIINLTEE